MINKNRKGFTLIELLAVIVIMGVLMVAAIPAISTSISNSRRETFATNAKQLINSVRTGLASGDVVESVSGTTSLCAYPGKGQKTQITITADDIEFLLERGGNQSSFGRPYSQGYIQIENTASASNAEAADKFEYSISLVDTGGNGTDGLVKESDLKKGTIKTSGASATAPTNPNHTCTINQ